MKISYNPEQLFDSTGTPLVAGRVSLYVHDSDVLLPVYTLSGDVYSVAQNPVILDDEGRMNTLWFDAAIVDVKVEQNVDGVYDTVDTYQYGFKVDEVKNDTVVYGMEGLAVANPELGNVTVVGYHNDHDCGPRCFVWDPTCTTSPDGGAIVASDSSETGRWILLSESRYMPSEYYGIIPGSDEANMAAFLSYPATVGQWAITLPPVPRFRHGTYTTNGSISSVKTVSFERGAKFTQLSLSCVAVEVDAGSDYVCDFVLTKAQQYAESRWFRTVNKFWGCGAYELHQSDINYFENSVKSTSTGIAYQRISGKPLTMTGTGRLIFTNCEFADRSLSTSWYTTFNSVSFTDRWFADYNWDFGTDALNHIRVNGNCLASLSDFSDANVWLLLQNAWGATSIDLEGRSVGIISASMPFTQVGNGKISEMHVNKDTVIRNCSINSLSLEDTHRNFVAYDSSITITGNKAASITLSGGEVSLSVDISTYDTAISAIDTGFNLTNGGFTRDDPADHEYGATAQFDRCTLVGGTVANNALYIRDSRVMDCDVYLFPQGTNSLSGAFDRNTWSGSSQLHICPGIDESSSMDIYNVSIAYLSIRDNAFNTSVPGIAMPFWAQDMEHRFVKGCCSSCDVTGTTATWVYGWVYQNNTGNCPASYGSMLQNFNDNLIAQITFGSGVHDTVRFCGGIQNVFVLPVTNNDGGSTVADEWVIADTAKACTPYKALAIPYNAGASDRTAAFPSTMYLPACALDKTLTNTMFDVYLGGSGAFVFSGAVPIPSMQ